MSGARRTRRIALTLFGAVGVLAAVVGVLSLGGGPASGPVDPVWDADVCAECHMHVGEPSYAAQAHLEDGTVAHFDDPGCLFRWVARTRPRVHAVYYHHHTEGRWIPEAQVAFVAASPTPMAYGLGAVDDPRPPGAIPLAQARARALAGGDRATAGAQP